MRTETMVRFDAHEVRVFNDDLWSLIHLGCTDRRSDEELGVVNKLRMANDRVPLDALQQGTELAGKIVQAIKDDLAMWEHPNTPIAMKTLEGGFVAENGADRLVEQMAELRRTQLERARNAYHMLMRAGVIARNAGFGDRDLDLRGVGDE